MRHVKEGEFKRALETVILYKNQKKAELERIDFALSGKCLSQDALIKNILFSSTTYRRLRIILPNLLNKPWDELKMADFKNTDYKTLFELVNKSKASIKNIESTCFLYGISLR